MSTSKLNFDVFISYRRDGGEILGRLLFELLKDNYNVFFDHESLSSGRFDTKLLDIISECNDVIVILSKGCLERCRNEGDWFMSEIRCALENNKNIVLLMTEDFEVPAGSALLSYPEAVQNLVKYNGHRINVAYIDSIITKLGQDLKTPKRVVASPFDSISEWKVFDKCLGDRKFAQMLPEELKMSIIHNSIDSFLDEYNAKIVRSVIKRLGDHIYNVRPKFRYEIDINSDFDFRIADIDSSRYYEMSESLSSSKIFRTGTPERRFWIAFLTNLDDLDSALRDQNFIFSENLTIEKEDMEKLLALDTEDKEYFYNSVMRVKLNINGTVMSPEEIVYNAGGIFGQYTLSDEVLNASQTFDVKIRFKVPQLYSESYFFASISEPTYAPFIRFSYPEDEFDVKMIPFLNRSLTAKDTKIFDGVRELSIDNEWVLPVSGAIFLINKH